MSSLLSNYEADFKTTLEQAKTLLSVAPTQPVNQRNGTLKEVEQLQDELLDLADQMEIEVNNGALDHAARSSFKAKLASRVQKINTGRCQVTPSTTNGFAQQRPSVSRSGE